MIPPVTVNFKMAGSCNNLKSRCCQRPDEQYWVSKDGFLEPWDAKKAEDKARAVAFNRFLSGVDTHSGTLGINKGHVAAVLLLDEARPIPVTRELVRNVSEAMAAMSKAKQAHPKAAQ